MSIFKIYDIIKQYLEIARSIEWWVEEEEGYLFRCCCCSSNKCWVVLFWSSLMGGQRKLFFVSCCSRNGSIDSLKVWNGKSSLRLEWSNKYWTACMPPSFVDIGMCKLGLFTIIYSKYLPFTYLNAIPEFI